MALSSSEVLPTVSQAGFLSRFVSLLKALIREGFFFFSGVNESAVLNKEIKSDNRWGRLAVSTHLIISTLVEAVICYGGRPSTFELQAAPLGSVQFHLLCEGLGQFDFLIFPLRASDCYG